MTHGLGLMIESLVALLLLLTIGYCMVLNGRLKRLRTDERAMREMIAELITATETAERSIGDLKRTVQESEQMLGQRLGAAERVSATLGEKTATAEKLLDGISGLSGVAAASQALPEPPPLPDAKAVVAAAQAFAERTRSRVFRQAA